MSRVRSKETKIEIGIRKELWKAGYRYRKNVSGYFGKPDILLKKYFLINFMGRNHKEWLKLEFQDKYLRTSYRNAIIHTSLIEGLVKKESKKNSFELANHVLLISEVITRQEFDIYEKIRRNRNCLLHDVFVKKLDEIIINNMIENLMNNILFAYRTSRFLKENILDQYEIEIPELIQ